MVAVSLGAVPAAQAGVTFVGGFVDGTVALLRCWHSMFSLLLAIHGCGRCWAWDSPCRLGSASCRLSLFSACPVLRPLRPQTAFLSVLSAGRRASAAVDTVFTAGTNAVRLAFVRASARLWRASLPSVAWLCDVLNHIAASCPALCWISACL